MNDPTKKVAIKITKRPSSTQSKGAKAKFEYINDAIDATAALMNAKSLVTTGHKSKNYSAWFAGQVATKTHQPTNQCNQGRLVD
jgi:hypothetical protein